LQNQDTQTPHEIIVVDSSDDGTGELIESHVPEIKLIRVAERTLAGAARNLGIEAAQGELLAFTDADCEFEPSWVSKILQAHSAMQKPCPQMLKNRLEMFRSAGPVQGNGCFLIRQFVSGISSGPISNPLSGINCGWGNGPLGQEQRSTYLMPGQRSTHCGGWSHWFASEGSRGD
jgi:glycosyltransferase involved in cell wall biosynthesis